MNMHFAVNDLLTDIQRLLLAHPELSEDDVLRADTFEGETDLTAVMSKLYDLQAEAKTMQAAIKERAEALAERKARYERREESIRNLMASVMEKAGLPKVTLPEATISVRHNQPAPAIFNQDLLPDDMVTTETKIIRKPDKAKIAEALARGDFVNGATMSNGSTTLTIRTK